MIKSLLRRCPQANALVRASRDRRNALYSAVSWGCSSPDPSVSHDLLCRAECRPQCRHASEAGRITRCPSTVPTSPFLMS